MSSLKKYSYDRLITFSLFLLIFFQVNTFTWISELLLSFGIPQLRFQKLFFLYMPIAYLLVKNIRINKINFSKISIFLIFYLFHFCMEYFLHENKVASGSELELNLIWSNIILGYIGLINTPLKYQIKIINFFIIGVICIFFIVYTDLYTNINVSNISEGQLDFEGRLNSNLNLNLVCDLGCLSIILLYYLRYNFSNKSFLGVPYFILVLYFITLIFLQASRGSLLLLLPVFFAFTKKNKNNFRLILPLFAGLLFLFISNVSFNSFNLFNRISNQSFNEAEALATYDGRFLQVISSYKNFLKSPITGVGYNNAAKGYYYGITRSNFQYTQILASGGLFLFILYFFMIFRFFCSSFRILLKDEYVWLFLSFVLLYFVFRRPNPFFSIIAYLVYCRELYAKK